MNEDKHTEINETKIKKVNVLVNVIALIIFTDILVLKMMQK